MSSYFVAVFMMCFVAVQGGLLIRWEPDTQKQDRYSLKDDVCSCSQIECICKGKYEGIRYTVVFKSVEADKEKVKEVIAIIKFGKVDMTKRFQVNTPEIFCIKVRGEKVCAKFEFKDDGTRSNIIDGCVHFTEPKVSEPSCFRLPTPSYEDYDTDEVIVY